MSMLIEISSKSQGLNPTIHINFELLFNQLRSMAQNVLAPILLCHWQNRLGLLLLYVPNGAHVSFSEHSLYTLAKTKPQSNQYL